jgi:hypothetical protein
VMYALRKRGGAKDYWDRVLESMDDLADLPPAGPRV